MICDTCGGKGALRYRGRFYAMDFCNSTFGDDNGLPAEFVAGRRDGLRRPAHMSAPETMATL